MHYFPRPSHAEIFVSAASDQTILVRCECPKRFDHYFEKPDTTETRADGSRTSRQSAELPRPTAFARSGPRLL